MSESKEKAISLHDQLVAYVHAITEEPETRSGVWVEHSYARSESAAGAGSAAGSGDVRELLAPRRPTLSPSTDEWLDVESVPAPLAYPDSPPPSPSDHEEEGEEAQWEDTAAALAPSATHARLLNSALETLRAARLARLSGGWGARRESVRAAATRLRRALAPLWALGGPVALRPAAWLHATLLASLPRPMRRLYDEAVAELRHQTPRLAERLMAGRPAPPPPPASPAPEESPPVAADAGGPWLLWLCASSAEESRESHWARRLRPLVHTRVWRPPRTSGSRVAPDAHCASLVAAARKALAEVLVEARKGGVSAVVVGGMGAGAALALDAGSASDPPPAGLLLLAPPLLTAEGARDGAEDPLRELSRVAPSLVVAGTAGAQCGRGAACEAAGGRVLVVHGADDSLRLPRAARRRLRLPQRALDAAVADECARWCYRVASAEAAEYSHLPPVDRIDIMQMPIVFADDHPPLAGDKYKTNARQVLVARRGRSLRAPQPLPLPL